MKISVSLGVGLSKPTEVKMALAVWKDRQFLFNLLEPSVDKVKHIEVMSLNRRVGKYHIQTTREDITHDNFFKWDIIINGEIIYDREIFYDFARILRYSDDETEIKEMIQCIIENRERSLQNLKELCN